MLPLPDAPPPDDLDDLDPDARIDDPDDAEDDGPDEIEPALPFEPPST